jgi:hypothetical protein
MTKPVKPAPIGRDTRDRAAIWCSIFACDRAVNDWRIKIHYSPTRRDLIRIRHRGTCLITAPLPVQIAWNAFKQASHERREMPVHERWALADAMLRSKEVP